MSNPSPEKPLEQRNVIVLRDELKERSLSSEGVKEELCEKFEDPVKNEENNENGLPDVSNPRDDENQPTEGDKENGDGEVSDPVNKKESEAKSTSQDNVSFHEDRLYSYKLNKTDVSMNDIYGLPSSKVNETDVSMNDDDLPSSKLIEAGVGINEGNGSISEVEATASMQEKGVSNSYPMKEIEVPALVPEHKLKNAIGCSSFDNIECDTVSSGDNLKGVQSLEGKHTTQSDGRIDHKEPLVLNNIPQPVKDIVVTERSITVQVAVSVGDVHIQSTRTASVTDSEASQLKYGESLTNRETVSGNVVAVSESLKNPAVDPRKVEDGGGNADCDTSKAAITKPEVLPPILIEVDANQPSHNVIRKHELCDQVSKHETIDENKDKLVLIRADVSTAQDIPGNVINDDCTLKSAEDSSKHKEIPETRCQQVLNIGDYQETDNIEDISLIAGKESEGIVTTLSDVEDVNMKGTSNKNADNVSPDLKMEEAENTDLTSELKESENVPNPCDEIEFEQPEVKISQTSGATGNGIGHMNDLRPLEEKRGSFGEEKDSQASSSCKRRDDDIHQEPAKRMRRWSSSKESVSSDVKPLTTGTINEIISLDKMQNVSPKNTTHKTLVTSKLPSVKADIETHEKGHGAPPSTRPPTTSLKVERFVRPFTLVAAKSLISEFGQCVEFWMDQIKTHCYCTYATTEEAIAARNSLYGKQWPPIFGNLLTAEFVDPSDVKLRCEGQLEKANGVANGLPAQAPRAIPNTMPSQTGYPSGSSRGNSNAANTRERPPPRIPKNPEPVVHTLDDLFMKTKAKPQIYYMPLTDEEASKKLASSKTQEQHPKRRRFGRA